MGADLRDSTIAMQASAKGVGVCTALNQGLINARKTYGSYCAQYLLSVVNVFDNISREVSETLRGTRPRRVLMCMMHSTQRMSMVSFHPFWPLDTATKLWTQLLTPIVSFTRPIYLQFTLETGAFSRLRTLLQRR